MRKIYFLAALMGIILGLVKASITPHARFVASQNIASSPLHAKAHPGGYQLNISTQAEVPIKDGLAFTLKAVVFSPQKSGTAEFIWWVPESVSVIDGPVETSLNFNSEGFAETEITLRIPSANKNYQIDGEAYRILSDGAVIGAIRQFNTNPTILESSTIKPLHKKLRVAQ